ncbi:MAG: hypothetical protein QOC77_3884 [Thermoleophilaceae bacterium]|nr:hypothetical protein [Thermoleophilaceae bacterium]
MAEENTIEQDNRDRDEDDADAGGADSAQDKAEQREDDDDPAAGGTDDQSDESKKAQAKEEEREAARETMEKIEEDPPKDLEDWPDDAAKYETFGGPEGDHSYEEGPEVKLGPSSLRHHESGAVTIEGEEVDDPDEYKGEPIPGGPTDEDAPQDLTTQKIREDQGRELESEKGDDGGDGDSDGGGASASKESDDDNNADDSADDQRGSASSRSDDG